MIQENTESTGNQKESSLIFILVFVRAVGGRAGERVT